jgi:preprotein translocase subunit YajC
MHPILQLLLAQTAPDAPQANPMMTIFPFIAIAVVFYLVFFRPQQKEQKRHQDTLSKLAKGNQVVTQGGIYGTVVSVENAVVTLDVGKGTQLRVGQGFIQRDLTQEEARKASEGKGKK